ncbi:MAG: PH domain-containing protein, partial [archaeon]|nr:PH domain-containing protein [archaeon]
IPTRRFIAAEKFQKYLEGDQYQEQEWFLFNDLLIGCRKPSKKKSIVRKGNLEVKYWMPMARVQISKIPESMPFHLHFGMKIVQEGKGNVLIFASSLPVMEFWYDHISAAGDAERERSAQKRASSKRSTPKKTEDWDF